MTTQSIALFKAMSAKMGYLDQRQQVIAQNVANSDTPGYRPRDLTKVDFGAVLKETTGSTIVRPETTHRNHMPSPTQIDEAKNRENKVTYEVAPAGNAVIIEEQMLNAAKTTMDYNLMTTLYQKNVGMIRTALGRGQ
jgi:flagellar basal-body rod protein FlgB